MFYNFQTFSPFHNQAQNMIYSLLFDYPTLLSGVQIAHKRPSSGYCVEVPYLVAGEKVKNRREVWIFER